MNVNEPEQPFRPIYAPPMQQSQVPARSRSSHTPLMIIIALIILILVTSVSTVLYLNGVPIPGLKMRGRQIAIASPVTTVHGAKVNPLKPSVPSATTAQMPSISTDCPAAGTGQTVITAPLVSGNDQNIIYIVNESHPVQGTIKRKDVTTGAAGIEIQKMSNVIILNAQISNDGYWVLFTAKVSDHQELRIVRVDGQGLQTLYCTQAQYSIYATPQWSLDQKHIIFAVSPAFGPPTTYLLDTTSGSIEAKLLPSHQSNRGYVPRLWLDNRYVYMVAIHANSDAPAENVYLLDTYEKAPIPETDLKEIITSPLFCLSFDTSYDLAQLIVGSCNMNGALPGEQGTPSQITIQPAQGGAAKTIFSSNTLAITMVRAVSPTMLLFQVENTVGDSSQNGIWKLNIDGTGLKRLSSDPNGAQALCQFTQYAWSNISRDGTTLAFQSYDAQKTEYALFYLHLPDGTVNEYADISDGTTLQLVGWTNI